MHRGQHTGTHKECAEQAEGKCGNRQQHGPAFEHAAFFGDGQRVDQRRTHQPGHEGSVFHRVPEPPATPTEFVVGPPRPQGDTNAEEGPGHNGPRPRPACPRCIQAPAEQGGDGEGEGHRETHVAHVEHRRVHDQADVLQQWVEVMPVHRDLRQDAAERVGGHDQEQQEADADHAHHRQHASQHDLRQLAREHRDGKGPAAEDQRPQQQRPLMGAPHGAELVVPGQGTVGVICHISDGEVVGHKGVGQATEGEQQERELAPGRRLRQAHPQAITTPGAEQRHHRLDDGKTQREDHRQLAQLRNKQCGRHHLALLGRL